MKNTKHTPPFPTGEDKKYIDTIGDSDLSKIAKRVSRTAVELRMIIQAWHGIVRRV